MESNEYGYRIEINFNQLTGKFELTVTSTGWIWKTLVLFDTVDDAIDYARRLIKKWEHMEATE